MSIDGNNNVGYTYILYMLPIMLYSTSSTIYITIIETDCICSRFLSITYVLAKVDSRSLKGKGKNFINYDHSILQGFVIFSEPFPSKRTY